MFDIGWDEMLFTAIVAIVVIGPKDLPRALRTAGQWIGKMRRMSNHFRSGIETMIREAELADMEKEWREKNAAIMEAHPASAESAVVGQDPGLAAAAKPVMTPLTQPALPPPPLPHAALTPPPDDAVSPELPLGPAKKQP